MLNTMEQEIDECERFPQVTTDNSNEIKQIIYPDLTEIESLKMDNYLSGLAKITFPDESTFQGNLQQAQIHGIGFFEQNETKIVANFANQMIEGFGVIQYPNSSLIKGTFHLNNLTGFGSAFETEQNAFYCGRFKNNQPDGIGALICGEQNYFGFFENGLPHGKGVQFSVSDLRSQKFNNYRGYFNQNARHGPGALFLANGDMLIGQFVNNEKTGMFLFVNEQGSFELRYYKQDMMQESYQSSFWVYRPQELKDVLIDCFSLDSFNQLEPMDPF